MFDGQRSVRVGRCEDADFDSDVILGVQHAFGRRQRVAGELRTDFDFSCFRVGLIIGGGGARGHALGFAGLRFFFLCDRQSGGEE